MICPQKNLASTWCFDIMENSKSVASFEIVFELEEDGEYHVYAPALKGCHSYGTTKEEARQNIAEAIELWLVVPERETIEVLVE